jgi:hydroxyethylthiazole kinase-like uncharacterized protein yjeF
MQNIFKEVTTLDQRCYTKYELTEDLLMEHAANGMAQFIRQHYNTTHSIIVVCGSGNNGADGIALARLLHAQYPISIYLPFSAKSPMAQLQLRRAKAVGVPIVTQITPKEIIVDALFGSGFTRGFDRPTVALFEYLNQLDAIKIACDIPSGIHLDGTLESNTFRADTTLTMGALKLGMFSDAAKDVTGDIHVIDLGVDRHLYETETTYKLLDATDIELPHRIKHNSHKGNFGHLSIVCGEKEGASVISGRAALHFGVGLVTLLSNENVQLPNELMQSHSLPTTTTAIALGMGLGNEFADYELESHLQNDLPLLLDADLFAHPMFLKLLDKQHLIMTPHPKEFTTILKACDLANISVETLQNNRFKYVELFCKRYPDVVLLLKGAHVIIAQDKHCYINPHGSNALAKGGSGDVLSGLIGALLAQGYTPLNAAIHGSLAHTLSSRAFKKNSYALTPNDLIEGITTL